MLKDESGILLWLASESAIFLQLRHGPHSMQRNRIKVWIRLHVFRKDKSIYMDRITSASLRMDFPPDANIFIESKMVISLSHFLMPEFSGKEVDVYVARTGRHQGLGK